MRTFGTQLFGLIFIVAFTGVFISHSVVGYPLSAGAVADTAKAADLYGAVLGGVDVAIKTAVKESQYPEFSKSVVDGMGDKLKEVISEDWFYETFETAYGAFVAFLEGSDEVKEIDFTDRKSQLRAFLTETLAKYAPNDAEAAAEVDKILTDIPDKVSITTLMKSSGRNMDTTELKEFREQISQFKTYRLVGFVSLLILLLLIAWIASSTRKRLLVSIGLVLLLSGGTYLAAASALPTALWEEVEKDMKKPDSSDAAEVYAHEAAMKVVKGGVMDAFGRSTIPVVIITVLGFAMFGAGLASKSRHNEFV